MCSRLKQLKRLVIKRLSRKISLVTRKLTTGRRAMPAEYEIEASAIVRLHLQCKFYTLKRERNESETRPVNGPRTILSWNFDDSELYDPSNSTRLTRAN